MKEWLKRLSVAVTAILLTVNIAPVCFANGNTEVSADAPAASSVISSSADGYREYSASLSPLKTGEGELPLVPADESYVSKTQDGKTGVLLSDEQRELTFSAVTGADEIYGIEIEYFAMPGRMKDIEFSLKIDGELPFDEAKSVSVSRIYADQGGIERDQFGNDIRPSQKEVYRFNKEILANKDGYFDFCYEFGFKNAGEHTVTLCYYEGSMIVYDIKLVPVKELISYKDYSKNASKAPKTLTVIEAEGSYEKSSSMLYPTYDRSSAATSPSHYSRIRYNTIGQSNWSHQGQWISWKVKVESDGWYNLSFKARQNYQQGINSYRTLYIDGEIPFNEVKNIKFAYDLSWHMNTLSNESGDPYLFKLSKGEHTIKLEVSAGPMGIVLKDLSESVLQLNAIYRSIIMVTGTSPDKYRTYYLEETVPGLIDDMKAVREKLDGLYKTIEEITGTGGSQASVVREMSVILGQFIKKPLSISTRITGFKDTIESLGSVILTLSEQPLELDYIVVSSKSDLPGVKAGFFESLTYGVKGFIASFVEDYNSVGSASDDGNAKSQVTVWLSNGRDQAQILKNLIDNKFTPNTGIGVSMSIVSTAAGTSSSPLVQATLAGKGPDVALFTPKDTPINLAMRGALVDVSELNGFKEVYDDFYPSAWVPYEYCGGHYAVPETQNYEMLFYRKDIFEELDISIPQTWDEFYTVVELLQKNNLGVGILETNALNAGISSGISFFEKQLLQNGGAYYTKDLKKTAFDTTVAVDAFKAWTDLYSEYGLDRSFDFFNRFRTGEMPIGIMSYPTYNQLYAAAPEIRGLWGFAQIPGTRLADGSIDRTETSAGTAAILLRDSKVKNDAWEFIKWWVSSDVQASYGTELEATLGVAARYDTANVEAFRSMGWSETEAQTLISQWERVTDIPQIPGNYFVSRCLTNAFRTVVDDGVNEVRTLNIYNKEMNAEIARKRAEFGLD